MTKALTKKLGGTAAVLSLIAILGIAVSGTWMAEAVAQENLTVMGHDVHRRVSSEGEGGNIVADFESSNGAAVEWLTFGVTPLHERLFREASLDDGNVDVAFLLNRFANEDVANLFEPLDEYQANDPIEDFDGISQGMKDAMTFDGKLYGIPFRHATHGLHFNETFLAEQGLDGPPETFEEFIDYAEKLTYEREDGTQVHGFVLGGQGPANIMDVVRAFGGDFLTTDFELKANEEGMVKAVGLLADFYDRGIMPEAYIGFTTEDVITFMQQGRAAMAINPFGRHRPFNDPEKSKHPGEVNVTAVPLSEATGGEGVAPVKTEIWALSIPKNAPNKELGWQFI